MVETITPVVHGGSRTRWGLAVAIHAAAATAVAAVFGALLAAVGALLGAPWGSGEAIVVAVVAAWAFAHEAFRVPFPVPQLRRQVPDWWRTFFSPYASAALYGAGLGIGFFTYLLHATLVVVAVAAFASGRPTVGAVLVGAFGLARGVSAVAAVRGPDVVHALAAFASRRTPLAAFHAAVVALVAVAVASSAKGPVDVARLALAAVTVAFAWGAAWKIVRFAFWRSIVKRYRLGSLERVAPVGVPIVETSVVVLAIAGAERPAAAVALAAVAAFTGAAARRRRFDGSRVPCGCFGSSETSFATLVARNAALAIAAVVAFIGAEAAPVRFPSPSDTVPVVLTVAGVVGVVAAALSVRRSLLGGRV